MLRRKFPDKLSVRSSNTLPHRKNVFSFRSSGKTQNLVSKRGQIQRAPPDISNRLGGRYTGGAPTKVPGNHRSARAIHSPSRKNVFPSHYSGKTQNLVTKRGRIQRATPYISDPLRSRYTGGCSDKSSRTNHRSARAVHPLQKKFFTKSVPRRKRGKVLLKRF